MKCTACLKICKENELKKVEIIGFNKEKDKIDSTVHNLCIDCQAKLFSPLLCNIADLQRGMG